MELNNILFIYSWEQRNLSELSSIRTGFPFDSKSFDDNGRYLVITNGNIQDDDCKVIMLTPSGIPYKQKMAYDLSKEKHLILLCGHYEGFDERIKSICDMFISVGDYILTGGEIPAMVLVDSITRLIPGVINEQSHIEDSFNDNFLLDYPSYTKPRVYEGMEVPEVLISGDHKKIDEYRHQESLRITRENRPDLLEK